MGKHWKSRRRRNAEAQHGKASKNADGKPARVGYDDIVKENKLFEDFYKCQKIVPECEWDSFMAALRDPLPASFRITGHRAQSQALLQIIEKEFLSLVEVENSAGGGEEPKPLSHVCLPWYPDRLAWQLNLTRFDIRRSEAYHKLHGFLISETESGNISRQETVSMIPPLVLDVQPHHKVLDMCAAPGSKTSQLIEALHTSRSTSASTDSSSEQHDDRKKTVCSLPEGLVVANDADNKRCYMLVHQAKRRPSPCYAITNHDAASMPNFFTPERRVLKFDRVLCDVPCSGDGTIRKNTDIWPKWNPVNGANLHGLQFNIARRGLQMLAVGGRLVYSTCSLNPIENEAVVARLLKEMQGTVHLVDASDRVPGLKFSPGLTHWTPYAKDMKSFNSPDDVPPEHQTVIRPHMFPPTSEMPDLKLCMRILPHQQNTGGFFVAVLEKVAPTPSESAADAEGAGVESTELNGSARDKEGGPVATEPASSPPRKKPKRAGGSRQGYKEDPYYFVPEDDPMLQELDKFYGLSDDFDRSLLMTRSPTGVVEGVVEADGGGVTAQESVPDGVTRKKNVYLCSTAIKDLLQHNQEHLKVINSGVKVFARCDNKNTPCGYRLCHEGADAILPFLLKRKAKVVCSDLANILQFDDLEMPAEFSTLEKSSQEELEKTGLGAIALISDVERVSSGVLQVQVVGWRGATSVRAYVPRHQKLHLLRLIGGDTTKYERNKFAVARSEQEKKAAQKLEELSADNGVAGAEDTLDDVTPSKTAHDDVTCVVDAASNLM